MKLHFVELESCSFFARLLCEKNISEKIFFKFKLIWGFLKYQFLKSSF